MPLWEYFAPSVSTFLLNIRQWINTAHGYLCGLAFLFLQSIYCGLENHRKSCFPHQQPKKGQSQTVSGIIKLQKQRCEDWPLLLHLSLPALPTSTSNTSTFLCQWDVAYQSLPLIHFYPWCCCFPILDLILALCSWQLPRAATALQPTLLLLSTLQKLWDYQAGPPKDRHRSLSWNEQGWLLPGSYVEAISPPCLGYLGSSWHLMPGQREWTGSSHHMQAITSPPHTLPSTSPTSLPPAHLSGFCFSLPKNR